VKGGNIHKISQNSALTPIYNGSYRFHYPVGRTVFVENTELIGCEIFTFEHGHSALAHVFTIIFMDNRHRVFIYQFIFTVAGYADKLRIDIFEPALLNNITAD